MNSSVWTQGGAANSHPDGREADHDMRVRNEHFTAAIENMSHGICMFDASERMIVCNGEYIRMFGLAAEFMVPGVTLHDILRHSVDVGIAAVSVDELYAERKALILRRQASSYPEILADGRIITISHRPMADGGWVSIYEDITERRRGEQHLEEQHRRFDAALSNMSQGLLMYDADKRLIVRNRQFLEIYRIQPADMPLGMIYREVLQMLVDKGIYLDLDIDKIAESTGQGLISGSSQLIYRELSDGRTVALSQRAMAGGGWVATFEDVTEHRRIEASIHHMAHHDALTGLANRVLFAQRLEQALAAAHLDPHMVAVFSLDLDRFKVVNDTLGHPVGDAILKAVASRLTGCVRERMDTVARVGGDEFSVLVAGVGAEEAAELAKRLSDVVSEPYQIDGMRIGIGTSIGISLSPQHGLDIEQLAKNADLALYRAKREGNNAWRFFDAGLDHVLQTQQALEADLRNALQREEFEVHYQPVIRIADKGLVGVEALVRWRCPKRGLVLPGDFIGLAEKSDLILLLGEWVLNHACAQAVKWPDTLRVAVNVSAVQLRQDDFATTVFSALAKSRLPANRLELEITETVLIDRSDTVVDTLNQLRAMGVRVALDDFGAGYSSLNYLRKFPLDTIKIDRAFVADIDNADTAAIVSAIVGLGERLRMSVTAEGVETERQLEILRAAGCTDAQGYLIGRPVPAAGIDACLKAGCERAPGKRNRAH